MSRPRRDPRTERVAQQLGGMGPRPRYDRTLRAMGGRLRRDPRAERAGQYVAGGVRPRYEIGLVSRGEGPVLAPRPQAAPEAAPSKILIIEAPAFRVAVVPDAAGGRLSAHDRQVLGAARALAGREGGVVILAPDACDGLGPAGADRWVRFGDDAAGYDPAARAGRLAALLAALDARHILFPESLDGGDLARRVAARMGTPLFSNAEVVAANGVIRPARGRRIEQRAAPGLLVTVAPDAVAEYGGPPREARPLDIEAAPVALPAGPILSATRIPADPATVPLMLADFVTAAGNGIRDLDTFRQLVTTLRATPGASRVLCDAGLMPRQTQVGASGTVLAATCYFALGISGAPQHLQGVAGCEHVVAVNTDLHAAMIERAGLAIVGDAQPVMDALLRLLAAEVHGTGEPS